MAGTRHLQETHLSPQPVVLSQRETEPDGPQLWHHIPLVPADLGGHSSGLPLRTGEEKRREEKRREEKRREEKRREEKRREEKRREEKRREEKRREEKRREEKRREEKRREEKRREEKRREEKRRGREEPRTCYQPVHQAPVFHRFPSQLMAFLGKLQFPLTTITCSTRCQPRGQSTSLSCARGSLWDKPALGPELTPVPASGTAQAGGTACALCASSTAALGAQQRCWQPLAQGMEPARCSVPWHRGWHSTEADGSHANAASRGTDGTESPAQEPQVLLRAQG
ncbi:caldesmon-like [Ammospiza nelsoni]|uniref:caldesmon-like n=1 Tax=Ammospiza nelsoni TaxID=2857394 RepID=UPI00286B8E25|nr:caldesmon-like [Ammospiza nelsoni]